MIFRIEGTVQSAFQRYNGFNYTNGEIRSSGSQVVRKILHHNLVDNSHSQRLGLKAVAAQF